MLGRRLTVRLVATSVAVLVMGAGAATADVPRVDGNSGPDLTTEQRADLDARAAQALERSKPGGERIAPDQIAWDDGAVVLTLAVDGQARSAVSDPPDGTVYLFEGYNGRGNILTFTECGVEDLHDYDFADVIVEWVNNQYDGAAATLYDRVGGEWRVVDSGTAVHHERFLVDDPRKDRADAVRICGPEVP